MQSEMLSEVYMKIGRHKKFSKILHKIGPKFLDFIPKTDRIMLKLARF